MNIEKIENYFDDGYLTVNAMRKIVDLINSKLPSEEKINLIVIENDTEIEEDDMIHEKTEKTIKQISKLSGKYQKSIIVDTRLIGALRVLYHADPLITSARTVPGRNILDLYFLYQPQYSTKYLAQYIESKINEMKLKILNNSSKVHPQGDSESCFSLALAILKDMTRKEFEEKIKGRDSYITNSLIKYSQSTGFLGTFSTDWGKKIFTNKETEELITSEKYRKNKKEEGNGHSKKLSEFSRKVLKEAIDNREDFSLSDLSSHESYEPKHERLETLRAIKEEKPIKERRERSRSRDKSRENRKRIIGLNRSRSSSSICSSN